MDRAKFTTVAHRHHRHCNPVDPAVLERALGLADLQPGQRVLDVGCGKAALLVHLAERFGARCIGIDLNPAFLAEGRAQAERRGVASAVTLIETDASGLDAGDAPFDLGLCIGATQAFGTYGDTLRELAKRVRPGGHLLVGEGYWKRAPAAEYLARLETTADELTTHEGNVAAGVAQGLEARGAWESSPDNWDRYEDLYARTMEEYVAAHPEDPDAPAMDERVRRWRETYRTWGRETLGFGLYLFRR